jgi:hypothetical protein
MAAKAHGWSNDETWQVASLIDNNEALNGEVISQASWFVGEAMSAGAKSHADVAGYAVPRLAQALRKRFGEALDRLASTVFTLTKHFKPDMAGLADRDIAGGLMTMASVAMQEVNWKEIAKHNLEK